MTLIGYLCSKFDEEQNVTENMTGMKGKEPSAIGQARLSKVCSFRFLKDSVFDDKNSQGRERERQGNI